MAHEDTSVRINAGLRNVLDKYIEDKPRYRNRSQLVIEILWNWVESEGLMETVKIGSTHTAELAEAGK